MTQLNVERKNNNNWWVWVLVVIAIFLMWWFFMRNDSPKETLLSPIEDTAETNNAAPPRVDTAESMDDTTVIDSLR